MVLVLSIVYALVLSVVEVFTPQVLGKNEVATKVVEKGAKEFGPFFVGADRSTSNGPPA